MLSGLHGVFVTHFHIVIVVSSDGQPLYNSCSIYSTSCNNVAVVPPNNTLFIGVSLHPQ